MSKSRLREIKGEAADAIREFGNELYRQKAINSKTPFENAFNQCRNGPIPNVAGVNINNSISWGYEINDVIFVLHDRKRDNDKPEGANILSISMSVKVVGNDVHDPNTIIDPFAHLEYNLIVKATSKEGKPLLCSWHLDRHLESEDDPSDIHPIYHFQYGGKNLELEDGEFEYGSNLVMDTPRFAHLPLDCILGCDFVLSNFFGDFRKRLCNESPSYRKYLILLQEQIWRPYAFATINHWNKFTPMGNSWSATNIWPQLLSEVKEKHSEEYKSKKKEKRERNKK